MYVNFLSTYTDKKSCHTSTTVQTSIARFVSDSWASCFYLTLRLFAVQGEVVVDGGRHVLFATSAMLGLLGKARRWYVDGTFKMVRRPFHQLLSIHAYVQRNGTMKHVPLLFVLMSHRRKQDYRAVFQAIKLYCPRSAWQKSCPTLKLLYGAPFVMSSAIALYIAAACFTGARRFTENFKNDTIN